MLIGILYSLTFTIPAVSSYVAISVVHLHTYYAYHIYILYTSYTYTLYIHLYTGPSGEQGLFKQPPSISDPIRDTGVQVASAVYTGKGLLDH